MVFLRRPLTLLFVTIGIFLSNNSSAQTWRSQPERLIESKNLEISNNGGIFHKGDIFAKLTLSPRIVVHVSQDIDLTFTNDVVHVTKNIDFVEQSLINIPSWKIFSHRDAFATTVSKRSFCSIGYYITTLPKNDKLKASLCLIDEKDNNTFSKAVLLPYSSQKDIGPIFIKDTPFSISGNSVDPTELIQVTISRIETSKVSFGFQLFIGNKKINQWFFIEKNEDGTFQQCKEEEYVNNKKIFLTGRIMVENIDFANGSAKVTYFPEFNKVSALYRSDLIYDGYLPLNLDSLKVCQ